MTDDTVGKDHLGPAELYQASLDVNDIGIVYGADIFAGHTLNGIGNPLIEEVE